MRCRISVLPEKPGGCQVLLVVLEMVRIQVKHGGGRPRNDADGELEFLFDCETSSTIEHITKDMTEIANLQLQIQQMGIKLLPRLSSLLQTPHHHRHPQGLHRAISEATSYVSKEQVVHGKPLSSLVLREHKRSVESEFALNYQLLGFPDANLEQLLSDLVPLQEDTVQLSWAGKEFMKGKLLRDYIGKNEKTKIVLRLQAHVSHPASVNSCLLKVLSLLWFFCLMNPEMDLPNELDPKDSDTRLFKILKAFLLMSILTHWIEGHISDF